MGNIVFVLSLPRSGSTFLQRLLMTSGEVASHSEPWLLLPILKYFKKFEAYSVLGEDLYSRALHDMSEQTDVVDCLRGNLSDAYRRTYSHLSSGKRYYLDKTPRYSYFASEIRSLFPEAKIIVLYRNPFSILSSMMDTWGKGRWNVFRHFFDLYDCQLFLNKFVESEVLNENTLVIKYEDLIADGGGRCLDDLEAFLGIRLNPEKLQNVTRELKGRLGDKTGIKNIKGIGEQKFGGSAGITPLRRIWMRRYMRWCDNNLPSYPYSANDLSPHFACSRGEASVALFFSDVFRFAYTPIHRLCKLVKVGFSGSNQVS